VKHAVGLRQRKNRDRFRQMLIEGCPELSAAVDAAHRIEELFFCPELVSETGNQLLVSIQQSGAAVTAVTAGVFAKLAYRENSGGLIAVAAAVADSLETLPVRDPALLLVVESIEKPGNLGGILRSADCAGVDGVIVCDPETDLSNPNVVRASLGTLFSVQVCSVSSGEAWSTYARATLRLRQP
jgi:TrmH family RNA methyltransferase